MERSQLTISAIAGLLLAGAASDSPGQSSGAIETHGTYGYFPTTAETELITNSYVGGGDYPRSRSPFDRDLGASDGPGLAANGLWSKRNTEENFYSRNGAVFEPLDSILGVMSPREVLMIESDRAPYTDAAIDVGLPFTRNFDPDRAHLKLGPLYVDLLSVEAMAIYSDYNSPDLELTHGDGWLSRLDLTARLYARVTENLYFAAAGTVYYLPGDGEVGLDLAASSRSFARLNWSRQIGSWYIHAYDEARVLHRANDILDPLEVDEIERSGRYRFGRPDDRRTNGFFDDSSLIYRNLAGVRASTLLNREWRASLLYDRTDFWETSDFDNHYHRDRAEVLLASQGNRWVFSPYLSYTAISKDFWDTARHRFWLGGSGRLSQNVRAFGRVGYLLSSGDSSVAVKDSYLYEGGLTHDISEDTQHSLVGGLTYLDDRFGDDGLRRYARYTLAHHFGPRVRTTFFASVSSNEDDTDVERWIFGGDARLRLSDYTNLSVLTRYEEVDYDQAPDADRWLHRVTLDRRLASRLYGTLGYQFEDYSRLDASFDEHLFFTSLTRYF